MSRADDRRAWAAALKTAAAARSVPSGAGWAAASDDLYVVSAISNVYTKPEPSGLRRASWMLRAKPRAVDLLLWRALGRPEASESARAQIMLRSVGAFALGGIPVPSTTPDFEAHTAASAAERAVAELESGLAETRRTAPDLTAFLALIGTASADARPGTYALLEALTAVAAGELDLAERLVVAGLASGRRQFVIGDRSDWQILAEQVETSSGIFAR